MGLLRQPTSDITKGVIWKQLLAFFFPLWFGTFFQQLYNTVDTLVVGRFVGKVALAAVGSTSVIVNLTVGIFTGLAAGEDAHLSECSFPHYIRSRWKKQARRVNSNGCLRSGGMFWPSGHFCRGKRRAPLAFPTGSV